MTKALSSIPSFTHNGYGSGLNHSTQEVGGGGAEAGGQSWLQWPCLRAVITNKPSNGIGLARLQDLLWLAIVF